MPDGSLGSAGLPAAPLPLSPSGYQTLLACGLRYVWEEAREPPRLPGSPAARLGGAVHDLLARAGRGAVPPDDSQVRQAWRETVEAVEGRMRQSWLERPFVPLRSRVRHYEETRVAAVRLAVAIARRSESRPGGRGQGGLPPEARLTSADGTVSGRIDIALWTPDGVVIRDYKTGGVLDDAEDGEQEIKVGYQLQLKMYAALHADARGEWPVGLELMTLAGEITPVPFTQAECVALFDEARSRAADLWRCVGEVRVGRAALTALATPGEACRWCRYRPVCPAYRPWTESQLPADSWSRDVWGIVRGVSTTRRSLAVVELDTPRGPLQLIDLDPAPDRNPALTGMTCGATAAVFDARPVSDRTLKAVDRTVLYRAEVGADA